MDSRSALHPYSLREYTKLKCGIELRVSGNEFKIFIESSHKQACKIAELSGKMVYCVDRRVLIRPTMLAESKKRTRSIKRKLLSKLNRIMTI